MENIEVVRLEPFQALLAAGKDVIVGARGGLRREDHILAPGLVRYPNQSLALPVAVALRRIEVADSAGIRQVQGFNRVILRLVGSP